MPAKRKRSFSPGNYLMPWMKNTAMSPLLENATKHASRVLTVPAEETLEERADIIRFVWLKLENY